MFAIFTAPEYGQVTELILGPDFVPLAEHELRTGPPASAARRGDSRRNPLSRTSSEQYPLRCRGGAAWPKTALGDDPLAQPILAMAIVDLRTDNDGKRLGHCRA